MRIARYQDSLGTVRAGVLGLGTITPIRTPPSVSAPFSFLIEILAEQGISAIDSLLERGAETREFRLLAPLEVQEVWGAGVTYMRSKEAREEESEGAARFYDAVYAADRPELFLKATPHRVVGPGEAIRVRADSRWTVPEPELGLVLARSLRLVGVTLGNDVSARDIEGANPLYLPQAKVYDACCALGPCVRLVTEDLRLGDVTITLRIKRDGGLVYEGSTGFDRMVRGIDELVGWLGRDNSFPDGVVLLTGTGIVPPDDLTLRAGDSVEIASPEIGLLINPVVQRGSNSA